jgi:hypothetical protein
MSEEKADIARGMTWLYEERNDFRPHCRDTISCGCRGEKSLGTQERGHDERYHFEEERLL